MTIPVNIALLHVTYRPVMHGPEGHSDHSATMPGEGKETLHGSFGQEICVPV